MKTIWLCLALLMTPAAACFAAPPPTLLDTSGARHQPLDVGKARAVVLIFIANECPISNSYAPSINRLYTEFASKGVTFYLVGTDAGTNAESARLHARAYGLRPLVLLDGQRTLVKYVGAAVTPEAFVYTPGGTLAYRGRIDNRYLDFGKVRPAATTQDLRAALTRIVEAKPVAVPRTKAVGCFL